MRSANSSNMISSLSALIVISLILGLSQKAQSQIGIPLNTFQKPAVDILDEDTQLVDSGGKGLTFGELAQHYDAGVDISKFNPVENKIWQKNGFFQKASDAQSVQIRQSILASGGVNYDRDYGGNREIGLYSIAVHQAGNNSNTFTLTLGTNVHTSMLRAALLRKLGFYQLSPIFFEKLKLNFKDKEEKQTFIDDAFCVENDDKKEVVEGEEEAEEQISISCLPIIPSLSKKNPRKEPFFVSLSDTELELRSVYLERMDPSIPSLIDGLTPATQSNVLNYGGYRGFRALIVPFAVADLGESINRTEVEAAKVAEGFGAIKVPFASDFGTADHFDLQWMIRQMAQLKSSDWMEIVEAAEYPDQCLNKMAYNNLIYRFRSMTSTFNYNQKPYKYDDVENTFVEVGNQRSPEAVTISQDVLSKVDSKYSCESGIVKNGLLTVDYFKDRPIRFKHDLVPSPWKGTKDILRWALIKVQTGLLNTGLRILTKKLEKNSKKVTDQTVEIRPGQPPVVLGTLTENRISADVHASRSVTTGLMLGSQSPVQLVDSLTFSVGAGHTILKLLTPEILRANEAKIFANRQYMFVKPIGSFEDAKKRKIKEILLLPTKLKEIAKPLQTGDIKSFLNAMSANEVFSITDTIGGSLTAGLNLGLDPISLLGIQVTPTLSIGGNFTTTMTKQTVVLRNGDGYQIVVRRLDPKLNKMISKSFFFDITAAVNWLHADKSRSTDWYNSEYYSFNYDTTFMTSICPHIFKSMPEYKNSTEFDQPCAKGKRDIEKIEDVELRQNYTAKAHGLKRLEKTAIKVLAPLLHRGDLRPLDADPVMQKRRFDIKNTVKTKSTEVRLMHYKNLQFAENQVVELRDPVLSDGTVNNDRKIKVAVSTRAELKGEDVVGFALTALDFFTKEKLGDLSFVLAEMVDNPANMPKGTAEWRVTETQSEITNIGGKGSTIGDPVKMPPMSTIRRYFAGWSLNQEEIKNLTDRINLLLPEELIGKTQLIPDGLLDRAGKIDFYRFIISLKIEKEGLDNISRLIFQEGKLSKDATHTEALSWWKEALTRLNQKITGKYRESDARIFKDVLELYGSAQYTAECKNESMAAAGEGSGQSREGIMFAGTTYPCLSKWLERLIVVSRKYDESNVEKATESMTEVLEILNQQIPMQSLLKVVGFENYRYKTNVIGFRAKDENARDSNYQGPIFGEPRYEDEYPDSLLGDLSKRYGLAPFVLNKTRVPFN